VPSDARLLVWLLHIDVKLSYVCRRVWFEVSFTESR
jgi:hypothetical protein